MVRAMDAVVAADADPAVAERIVRAARDGRCRARIRPGRVDFLVDDLVVARRRRRRDLARANRIEGNLLVVADGCDRAGGEVDDESICKFYLCRCLSLGGRLLHGSCCRRLGRRRDERLTRLRDERDDIVIRFCSKDRSGCPRQECSTEHTSANFFPHNQNLFSLGIMPMGSAHHYIVPCPPPFCNEQVQFIQCIFKAQASAWLRFAMALS